MGAWRGFSEIKCIAAEVPSVIILYIVRCKYIPAKEKYGATIGCHFCIIACSADKTVFEASSGAGL